MNRTVLLLALLLTMVQTDGTDQPYSDVVAVERGRSVALSPVLRKILPRSDGCQVRLLGEIWSRCSNVQPDVFDCMVEEVTLYHYGCYRKTEQLQFQVETDINSTVTWFQVAVHILPANHPLTAIGNTIRIRPFLRGNTSSFQLDLEFPSKALNACYYSLAVYPGILPLPQFGNLSGPINRPLTCGYTLSDDPFVYTLDPLHLNSDLQDYVIILLWENDFSEALRILLPIKGIPMESLSFPLSPIPLVISHTAGTPLEPNLFQIPASHNHYLTIQLESTEGTFASHPCDYCSAVSVFTVADLLDQSSVGYFPHSLNSSSGIVNYTIFDLSGKPLLESVILVISDFMQEILPVILNVVDKRDNIQLDLLESVRNANISEYCYHKVTEKPKYGYLQWVGNDNQIHDTLSLVPFILSHSSLISGQLSYHLLNETPLESTDQLHWQINCMDGFPLTIVVRINYFDQLPTPSLHFVADSFNAVEGQATQLTNLFIQSSAPKSNDWDTLFFQANQTGSLFLAPKNLSFFHSGPMINASDLLSLSDVSSTIFFRQRDLDLGLLWYVPPLNANSDNILFEFDMISTSPLSSAVLVLLGRKNLEEATFGGPTVTLPRDFRLSSFQTKATITSDHLSVKISSEVIVHYLILRGPFGGYLCMEGSYCNQTITGFTQDHINSGLIYYQMESDSLDYDAVLLSSNIPGSKNFWFLVEVSKPVLVEALENIWNPLPSIVVEEGFLAVLSADIFQYLSDNDSLLTLVRAPKFGDISHHVILMEQLISSEVIYINTLSGCVDKMVFLVSSNHTNEVTFISLDIIIRRKQDPVFEPSIVTISHPSLTLSIEHINISNSPFCREQTILQITRVPESGQLIYGIPDDFLFPIPLSIGAAFTIGDIYQKRIGFELINPMGGVDYFAFRLLHLDESLVYNVTFFHKALSPGESNYNISHPSYPIQHVSFITADFYGFHLENVLQDISIYPLPAPKSTKVIIETEMAFPFTGQRYGLLDNLTSPMKSEFPLEDAFRSVLTFTANPSQLGDFPYGIVTVYLNLTISTAFFQDASKAFELQVKWSAVFFEQQHITIEEGFETVSVIVRRMGDLTVDASIHVSVLGGTIENNCFEEVDSCVQNSTLYFKPDQDQLYYNFTVFDDTFIEEDESLTLSLSEGHNVIPMSNKSRITIVITDNEPPINWIRFSPKTSQSSKVSQKCDFEIDVPENIGTISIPVTRTGNLREEVGVICYTSYNVSLVTAGRDFVHRPDSPESVVLFRSNLNHTSCEVEIIDDNMHEPREPFYVLLGVAIGGGVVDRTADRVCVNIVNSIDQVPVIGFVNKIQIMTRPSPNNTLLGFVLLRTGPPESLNQSTTVTLRFFSKPPNDTAIEGIDYVVISNSVTFLTQQSVAIGHMEIISKEMDNLVKTLHIQIAEVTNGFIAEDGQDLLVQIIPKPRTIVQFQYSSGEYNEDSGQIIRIPIVRVGDLDYESRLLCVLQYQGSAKAEEDYHTGLSHEIVHMEPNQKRAYCHLSLIDDSKWEQSEFLVVLLRVFRYQDMHTEEGAHTTFDVIINDSEDIPKVGFESILYQFEEPLSNFPVDEIYAVTKIRRHGDPSQTLLLKYTTELGDEESRGVPGIDYISKTGIVKLPPNVETANISVKLLSNHNRVSNFNFYVRIWKPENATLPLLGRIPRSEVFVHNHQLRGAYFPSAPKIYSSDVTDAPLGLVYHDVVSAHKALLCLSPCDSDWIDDTSEYERHCEIQQIDPKLTIYTWEMSTIFYNYSHAFLPVNFTNVLATPKERYLDPVYMFKNRRVRCRATAVDRNGQAGYSRVSQPIRLQFDEREACLASEEKTEMIEFEAKMEPTARNPSVSLDDIVKLTLLKIPHFDNHLPVVSTRPLPEDITPLLGHIPTRRNYPCSSFAVGELHSLRGVKGGWDSGPPSTSEDFSRLHCWWTFESYHSIRDLVEVCGGSLVESDGMFTLKLPLYLTYVMFTQFTANQVGVLSAEATADIKFVMPTIKRLTSPVQYIRDTEKNVTIEMVSISSNYNLLEVIFRVSMNVTDSRLVENLQAEKSQAFHELNLSIIDLELLQTSPVTNPFIQLWKMSSRQLKDYSGLYNIQLLECKLWYQSSRSFCLPNGKVSFQFQLEKNETQDGYMVAIVPRVILTGIKGESTEFRRGDDITLSIEPSKEQVILDDAELQIDRIEICPSDTEDHNCFQPDIISTTKRRAERSAVTFTTKDLREGNWLLKLDYFVVNGSTVLFPGPAASGFLVTKMLHIYAEEAPSKEPVTSKPEESLSFIAIISFSISAFIAVVLLLFCCIIIVICFRLKRVHSAPAIRPVNVRNRGNVRIHFQSLAAGNTRIDETKNFVCEIEVLQETTRETQSLPEVMSARRTGNSMHSESSGTSPTTISNKSLPANLPSQSSPSKTQHSRNSQVVVIKDNSETGRQLMEYAEGFLAVMGDSPKDIQTKSNL